MAVRVQSVIGGVRVETGRETTTPCGQPIDSVESISTYKAHATLQSASQLPRRGSHRVGDHGLRRTILPDPLALTRAAVCRRGSDLDYFRYMPVASSPRPGKSGLIQLLRAFATFPAQRWLTLRSSLLNKGAVWRVGQHDRMRWWRRQINECIRIPLAGSVSHQSGELA